MKVIVIFWKLSAVPSMYDKTNIDISNLLEHGYCVLLHDELTHCPYLSLKPVNLRDRESCLRFGQCQCRQRSAPKQEEELGGGGGRVARSEVKCKMARAWENKT